MKKTLLLLALTTLTAVAFAQRTLPSANVKTLEGQIINVQELGQSGHITVIIFWATWCAPCKKELDAIKDYYGEWKEQYGMELIAVSVDDARTVALVPAMVAEKGWDYRILFDTNNEFKVIVPYTLLLDAQGNIVYDQSSYSPGDELELLEQIKRLR